MTISRRGRFTAKKKANKEMAVTQVTAPRQLNSKNRPQGILDVPATNAPHTRDPALDENRLVPMLMKEAFHISQSFLRDQQIAAILLNERTPEAPPDIEADIIAQDAANRRQQDDRAQIEV